MWYFATKNGKVTKLDPGVHGLSNDVINSPWPKVEICRDSFIHKILKKKIVDVESIFKCMSNTDQYPDEILPDTGVGIELERYFSSIFIPGNKFGYGTRCTTIILVDSNDHVDYYERSYKPGLVKIKDIHIDFDMEDQSL